MVYHDVPPATASYEELRKHFSTIPRVPNDFSFPTHVLDRWAESGQDLTAIHWVSHDFRKEAKITYKELSDLSNRAAVAFSRLGVKKGDKVMVQLPRVWEWWVVLFGLMRIGAIPVPGTSLLVAKDLKYRAKSAKASAFVGDSSAADRFEEISKDVGISLVIQVRVDDDGGLGAGREDLHALVDKIPVGTKWKGPSHKSSDLAILYFTSGTTGMPKQVLLENEYTFGFVITGYWYRLGPGKLFANLADLGWAKAAYSTFGCLNMGATLFVQPPPPGPFSAESILAMLHRYPITTMCCPPTIYRSLVTTASLAYMKKNPLKALEHCVGAGEPLNPSIIHEWRKATGVEICDAWGQTETIILVGNFLGVQIREGSMGKVAPGFEVGVVGPEGEMAVGEEGELCCRTDQGAGQHWIFKGYVKDGGQVDSRRKTIKDKEWYTTGDRGYKDKDGYFWFVGRDDDVISSAGYRIGPFEVESALKEHPAVVESAVVASPDRQRGEIVKAFIIPSAEYGYILKANDAEVKKLIGEIQEYVRKASAPYKYPREIEFVDALPKTVSGKIRRIELRDAEYRKKADIVKQLKAKL